MVAEKEKAAEEKEGQLVEPIAEPRVEPRPGTSELQTVKLDKAFARTLETVGKNRGASMDEIVAMHLQLDEFVGKRKM